MTQTLPKRAMIDEQKIFRWPPKERKGSVSYCPSYAAPAEFGIRGRERYASVEIAEDLQAALAQFAEIANDLSGKGVS